MCSELYNILFTRGQVCGAVEFIADLILDINCIHQTTVLSHEFTLLGLRVLESGSTKMNLSEHCIAANLMVLPYILCIPGCEVRWVILMGLSWVSLEEKKTLDMSPLFLKKSSINHTL